MSKLRITLVPLLETQRLDFSPNALAKVIIATFVSSQWKIDAYCLKQSKLEIGHDGVGIQLQIDVLERFLDEGKCVVGVGILGVDILGGTCMNLFFLLPFY